MHEEDSCEYGAGECAEGDGLLPLLQQNPGVKAEKTCNLREPNCTLQSTFDRTVSDGVLHAPARQRSRCVCMSHNTVAQTRDIFVGDTHINMELATLQACVSALTQNWQERHATHFHLHRRPHEG